MTGRLIGVGVGPGAADLVTLRAADRIRGAGVVAYPTLAGAGSMARAIVADLMPPAAAEIAIDVPMTRDRAPAQAAYDAGAARIAAALDAGRDVVVLCEGDPLLYGSFMYLHARLRGRYRTEIVPGVSSLTAAAAAAQRPLAARNEVFTVIPAPLGSDRIARHLAGSDSVAILKVGRHLGRIRELVGAAGLTAAAIYAERVSLGAERLCPLAEAPATAPYFSMILVVKGADPWL